MILGKYILLICTAMMLLIQCKNPESNPVVTVPDAPMTIPDGFIEGGINNETMEMLLSKADHIDYIFNEIPLSMNQDGQNAILQDLSFISNRHLPGIPSGCSPLARKIYLGSGEILIEADIYFSEGCLFQIYIRDEKQLFGNLLSQDGITFYKNLMKEARKSMPENVRNSYTIPSGI